MSEQKRLLICDDSKQIAKVLSAQFEKAGYDVVCVENGLDMLEKVIDETFDLVLTDIMMPGGNGAKAIVILRKLKMELPVVVYSAWTDGLEVPDGVTVLHKPMPLAEVVAKVNEVLGT